MVSREDQTRTESPGERGHRLRQHAQGEQHSENKSQKDESQFTEPSQTSDGMSGARAARLARTYLADLTGKLPETVSALTRQEGGWLVRIEMVETSRIPNTSDVLGSYEVDLDENGELLEYRRTRRYFRNQAGDD
jgi:hypothetical protein